MSVCKELVICPVNPPTTQLSCCKDGSQARAQARIRPTRWSIASNYPMLSNTLQRRHHRSKSTVSQAVLMPSSQITIQPMDTPSPSSKSSFTSAPTPTAETTDERPARHLLHRKCSWARTRTATFLICLSTVAPSKIKP